MTNIMRKEIMEILEYLKNNKDILDYKLENTTIYIKTDLDREDIDFLKFRILAACAVIEADLENKLKIEIM